MLELNVKRFVDINIKQYTSSVLDGTRDTAVVLTNEGISDQTYILSSLAEAKSAGLDSTCPNAYAYCTTYFNNGGRKLLIACGYNYASDTFATEIAAFENKYICIAYAMPDFSEPNKQTRTAIYNAMKQVAQTRAADASIYGINEKLIIVSTDDASDASSVKNFVVKYSSSHGSEMTIAAYLSQIDCHGVDTVYDYAFTEEVISDFDTTIEHGLTDTMLGTLMDNNINVDTYLSGAVRLIGGNCKDGSELTNNFVRIVLHQTLTDLLLSLLSEKIKGTIGASKIYTVICQELNRYLTAGYLTTDKIWTDSDLKVTRNGKTYTIVTRGTALSNGYIVSVLPFEALTESEKTAHSAPPIYIIIADQYAIRKITVAGEVV